MHILPAQAMRLSTEFFEQAGAPPESARAVSAHLVESSLMGLNSHGVIRIPEYLAKIDAYANGAEIPGGAINPAAQPSIETHDSGARVNGVGGFGQVAAYIAADTAADIAKVKGMSLVTTTNMGHIGRLGAYVTRVADAGLGAIGFCSAPRWGHWVSPFGGRDGRFATNPIAYAFPNAGGQPLVADFATSSITEGAVRYIRNTGGTLPADTLRDSAGEPTNDPNDLYTDPRGTIQPLGGATGGHKGTALSVLVEIMSTILAGDNPVDPKRIGNNMTLVVFATTSDFASTVESYVEYVRSSESVDQTRPVMMPGDRENAQLAAATVVEFDDATWRTLTERGNTVGIDMEQFVDADRGRG